MNGARPGELVTLKLKVGDCRQRVEIFAVRHRCFAVVMQDVARVVAVHMITYERETPVKRPHEAVVIPLVMRALAPMHECFPQNSINLSTSLITNCATPRLGAAKCL